MAYSPSDENAKALDQARMMQRTLPHLRVQTAVIATADASSDVTAIALVNQIKATLNAHLADAYVAATGLGAHVIADPNVVVTANATIFNDVYALESECRARFHAHLVHASHVSPDANGNVVLPSTAESGANTAVYQRLSLLKAAINVHLGKTMLSAAAT